MMMMHSRNCKCSKNNNNNVIVAAIIFTVLFLHCAQASPNNVVHHSVKVNKCCERFEILVDSRCTAAESINACNYSL